MAKRFTFSAETLLRSRRQELTRARQELAAATAARAEAAAKLAAVEGTLAALDASARAAIEAGTTGERLEGYRSSMRAGRTQAARRRERLATAEALLERCRREVAERMKESKVLESVKQNRLAAHERTSRRSESDQRDDEHAARTAARGEATSS